MSDQPIRVLLVDDHGIVRDGLKALLVAHDDIEVVGEAGSVSGAVAEADRCRPDVVVMDVLLSDGSGVEATRQILARRPHTQVLMLTVSAEDETLLESITAGAVGYVLKKIHGNQLVDAIRTAGAGQSPLDAGVARSLLARVRSDEEKRKDPKLARLGAQEGRILALLAEGKTNKQIAEALFLAEKTVRNYVSSILDKLEVSRRAEAAAYLARHQAKHSD